VAGHLSEAHEKLTEALALYESKGDVPSAERARESLELLAAQMALA
jgi:hypothetical protein